MEEEKSQIARTWRGPVEYQLAGAGPVVMVLKGGHCTRKTRLSHERLAGAGFTVLTPSRPGYDDTPADLGETAPEAARTLAALLDHLNIVQVSVIGISAAGPTALAFAALFPDRTLRLVLEAAKARPWPAVTEQGARVLFGKHQALTWAVTRQMLRLAPRATVRLMLAQLSSLPIHYVMAGLSRADQTFVEDMIRASGSGRGGFINDLQHVIPDLAGVKAPALVMFSPHDGSVTPDQARLLLSGLPRAQGHEVRSDSHLLWIGPHAYEVWERRLAFLRS